MWNDSVWYITSIITADGICFRQCCLSKAEITGSWQQKFHYYDSALIFQWSSGKLWPAELPKMIYKYYQCYSCGSKKICRSYLGNEMNNSLRGLRQGKWPFLGGHQPLSRIGSNLLGRITFCSWQSLQQLLEISCYLIFLISWLCVLLFRQIIFLFIRDVMVKV